MRLLTFLYIVLNSSSKGRDGVTVIRSNLAYFINVVDFGEALDGLLMDRKVL